MHARRQRDIGHARNFQNLAGARLNRVGLGPCELRRKQGYGGEACETETCETISARDHVGKLG